MQLTLIKNENYDDTKTTLIKLAKVIYAETRASSLMSVESLGAIDCKFVQKLFATIKFHRKRRICL
ncbi:MAG: hypothetical protein WC137_02845 [Alphaproteobacteria bacterium]